MKCGAGIDRLLNLHAPYQTTANSYPSICSKPLSSARTRSAVCFCTATSATEAEAISDADEEQKKIKDAADLLDIRVGLILRAWRHEEADSLYVEEVDIGEPEPRIICSGLVNYIPIDHLQVCTLLNSLLTVSYIFMESTLQKLLENDNITEIIS